jgi:hypothetical protein
MELWHISQDENSGYDTFSDAVVAAETEDDARHTLPADWIDISDEEYSSWCDFKFVKVTHIGTANSDIKAGVICASFHAG